MVLTVFLLSLLAVAARPEKYFGDERFYTDASIAMRRTGDYLVPRYPDGSMRFKKPPLTYWMICASYQLFGANLTSSRLPFILSGLAVLGLVYRYGKDWLGGPASGWLAVVVLSGSGRFLESTVRSTPDVVVTLFMGLSMLGFGAILLQGRRDAWAYALAYAGAGLGFASKGWLGILPVLYALLYSLLRRPQTQRWSSLIHPGWMTVGLVLAGGWFALVFARHGSEAIATFMRDQSGADTSAIRNFPDYTLAVFRHFLPWTALAAVVWLRDRSLAGDFFRRHREVVFFAVGWFLLIFAIFGLGHVQRVRYLLPAYPPLAALLGAWFAEAIAREKPAATLRLLGQLMLGAGCIAGPLVGWVGGLVATYLWVGGLAFTAICVGLCLWARNRNAGVALAAVGTFCIAVYGFYEGLVRPAFSPSPATAMAATLRARGWNGQQVAGWGLSANLMARIRVMTGGEIELLEIPGDAAVGDRRESAAVLFPARLRERLDAETYAIEACGWEYNRWRSRDVLALLRSNDRASLLEARRKYYFLAVRRSTRGS